MRNVGFCLLTIIFITAIGAPVEVSANEGITTSTELELQVSSLPEAKLSFSQSFSIPFLRGHNPLVADNNVKLVLGAYVTPVSAAGTSELIWTPVAFFLLSGGGQAGSGWNIPLGDGIGINTPVGPKMEGVQRQARIEADAFDGVVWKAWGAGTFQFDLGAIFPGDWTHVIFLTRQEFCYSAYTRADSSTSWIFENDDGENRNGWKYRATYVLGYQMPNSPILSMVGFMAELEKNLYNFEGGDFWGDGLGYWILSGMGVFTVTPRFNAMLAIQMRTRRNHGNTRYNSNDYYYQDIELSDENGQRRLVFYRAALILNYKLR